METETRVIRIAWDGPFTLKETERLNDPKDYGVYQVYGPHPTYCRIDLLYIGLASKQSFCWRIRAHGGWIQHTRDHSQVAIYVGRLLGPKTPANDAWEEEISLVEHLLIYAHYPTYNRQKDAFESDLRAKPSARNLHVLNLGKFRDLLPEASGLRYSDVTDYEPYGSDVGREGQPLPTAASAKSVGL
jgi:hypothetical protein